MFSSSSTIYQRTQAGRDEIYSKQAGLTQSERLVLIMVDGTAPCQEMRAKLPSLKDERFERAMRTLLKKELICEVFLEVEGQEPDQIESEVVDRFLQQDPTDPVTIISYDPEEDFGEFALQTPTGVAAAKPVPPIPELDVVVAPTLAVDEVHAKMADSLQQEVQARNAERRQRLDQVAKPVSHHASSQPLPQRQPVQQRKILPQQQRTPPLQPALHAQHAPQSQSLSGQDGIGFHWGYWLIGIGLSVIIGFVVAKLVVH